MNARQAHKVIQWYHVYQGEMLPEDKENELIYLLLLYKLKGCHDIIEGNDITYDQLYEHLMYIHYNPSPFDFDEESEPLYHK